MHSPRVRRSLFQGDQFSNLADDLASGTLDGILCLQDFPCNPSELISDPLGRLVLDGAVEPSVLLLHQLDEERPPESAPFVLVLDASQGRRSPKSQDGLDGIGP